MGTACRREEGRGDDRQSRRAAYAKPINVARVVVPRTGASGRSPSWQLEIGWVILEARDPQAKGQLERSHGSVRLLELNLLEVPSTARWPVAVVTWRPGRPSTVDVAWT
jgi:hypothetical protein